jgi:hypothetical protein
VLKPDSSRGLLCYSDFLHLSPEKRRNFLDGVSVLNKSSCVRRKHRKTETNSYVLSKIRTYDPMFEQPKASSGHWRRQLMHPRTKSTLTHISGRIAVTHCKLSATFEACNGWFRSSLHVRISHALSSQIKILLRNSDLSGKPNTRRRTSARRRKQ